MESITAGVVGVFGKNLARVRRSKGLSQAALATKSGVGLSTVQTYEHGIRDPGIVRAVALARALDVTLDALVTQASENTEDAA